ncbi:MAG: alpha/beta fold hydrolase [Flavobacteriaceae bacterium]|nr:alpha/beta fold hydrolase [Flavobacteriaceae bacterium]
MLYSNIEGTGTPFLILHGFLGMGDNWKTLGTRFAENGFEVHMIDQRNHGRSFHADDFSYELMAEDLKHYCYEKNLKNFVLLGHSMGGKSAMLFATKYQDYVSKLIVADIAPKHYPQHHQDILMGLSSLDFKAMDSRGDADNQLKKYISNFGIRQFLLKNLYRIGQDDFALRLNLPALIENIEEVGKGLPDDAKYEGETLFIRGGRSGYIEEMDEMLIKKHFPKAAIATVPDAGHWLHAEKPDEFYKETERFL